MASRCRIWNSRARPSSLAGVFPVSTLAKARTSRRRLSGKALRTARGRSPSSVMIRTRRWCQQGSYGFAHWALYNVPASVTSIPAGTPDYSSSGYGDGGYGGPMPPPGHGTHHYFFWLFALSSEPDLDDGTVVFGTARTDRTAHPRDEPPRPARTNGPDSKAIPRSKEDSLDRRAGSRLVASRRPTGDRPSGREGHVALGCHSRLSDQLPASPS